MDDRALKERPNDGRLGRPFGALMTNGRQPMALLWAIWNRPFLALALIIPFWAVDLMRDARKQQWGAAALALGLEDDRDRFPGQRMARNLELWNATTLGLECERDGF